MVAVPGPEEARAQARLDEVARAIVVGVERALPGWARAQVERILDAWGRVPAAGRAEAGRAASLAGEAAAARVGAELRALLALDPADQRATPLEIARSAYREPGEVLARLGVPPVVRDEFDERAWPADVYGLVPRSLADLGDDDLGPLLLAWGVAKASVLRSRSSHT